MLELKRIEEHKIGKLLPECSVDDRLEASGVFAKDGYFYVIFDNLTQIAKIKDELLPNSEHNVFVGKSGGESGFEGITYSEAFQRFYVAIEALPHGRNYRSKIEEYDDNFNYLESHWVDFKIKSGNKGFEGLAYWNLDGNEYLLALCEGNKGGKPGGGRIQILQKMQDDWKHVGTIKIPKAVKFKDYSSIAIKDKQIGIVSQESSKLWVGKWLDFADEGTIYDFPKDKNGKILYGNVEGVSWIALDRVVVVSDKRKKDDQPKRYKKKDQSIHIFEIPGHSGGN